MELETKNTGVAKAGLTTGIIGSSLGLLNSLGTGLFGGRAMSEPATNEDHLVDRYVLSKEQEIAELKSQIALRDANTYSDSKMLDLYKYFVGELNGIKTTLSAQEVKNQSTADSFQMVSERLNGVANTLGTQIAAEAHERRCNDNILVNYMNATFYPKMVADVTTGTTTTSQVVYDPLPAQSIGGN